MRHKVEIPIWQDPEGKPKKKKHKTKKGNKMKITSNKYLSFSAAFELIKNTENLAMRLPSWQADVFIKVQHPDIKVQHPDKNSKMTAPYLYVESRFGCVPWKETMIELFSDDWEIWEPGFMK